MDTTQLHARLEWFRDLKFGFMVHWGIYSQWGCVESWPMVPEDKWARPDGLPAWEERGHDVDRFQRDYIALNQTFNPQHFDSEAWADLAVASGTKYFVFTTKHHDGFCLYDTKTTTYKTTDPSCPFHTSPRADAVKGVFDACRARDLAIGAYFSKADWHAPEFWKPGVPAPARGVNYDTDADPERWSQFQRFTAEQIHELMAGYGPIDILWLDAGWVQPPKMDLRMVEIAVRSRQTWPKLLVVDRCAGGELENYTTPEQTVPDKALPQAWESCITLGDQWSYKPDDAYKSPRQVIHLLCDIVAKGGNLLINVGPDSQGVMPERAVRIMREVGAWLKTNGEAIYGSRAVAPYRDALAAYTRRGTTVYAIVFTNEEGQLPAEVALPFHPTKPAQLVDGGTLPTAKTDAGVNVTLPKVGASTVAVTVKLPGAAPAD